MAPLARIPLDGGGSLLVEAPAGLEGPVKAGRLGEAVHELPKTLQEALVPVTEAARVTLEQLRRAQPDEIAVGFGVDLAVEAGAVITKTGAQCHLNVTMRWTRKDPEPAAPHEGAG
ncbi:CU044_2847 family protein [Streptomyces sp. NPDC056387]|uniref:CU044_2847 family protein n=1 Tax=Streptomyces sp. NPDC056387 TaxID=3345803 RepID=UPI0035D6024F